MRKSKAGSGILTSASAGIIVMLAGLLLIPLNIHVLGAATYGIWLTISAIAMLLYYSDLGVGIAIIHFGSRARSNVGTIDNSTLLSCGVAWTAVIWAILSPIFYFGVDIFMSPKFVQGGISSDQGKVLIALGIFLLGAMVAKPFAAMLTGAGFMNYERRNQISGALIRIVGTLIACLVFKDIVALAIAETLALVAPPLLSARMVIKNKIAAVSVSLVSKQALKEIFGYSTRAFATGAVGALILQAGTLVVATVGTTSDVTYFTAAFRVYSSVRQLISWITEPFRPLMSRLWSTDAERARTLLLTYLSLTATASVIGSATLMFASSDIVSLWLPSDVPQLQISLTIIILLAGMIFNSVHIPIVPALDGAGRPGAFLILQTIWLIMYVVLAFILGPNLGISGVAIAMTLPLILLEPFYWIKANRILGLGLARWARETAFMPGCALLIGLCVAAISSLILAIVGISISGWMMAGTFLTGSLGSIAFLREKFALKKLVSSLKVEL